MARTKKRLLLTGGHAASSAFVISEEIRRQNKPWEIYWIGFGKSLEGENVATLSSIYFPKYGIKTYNLVSGRLQLKWTKHTVPSLLKIPLGFVHSFFLLLKIRPDLVLSFGGSSAFPVVVVAYILRIPVVIHEQTSVVGRANKYSSFFAKKIALSRESSKKYFPPNKTVLTGNPVSKDLIDKSDKCVMPKVPTIMVTGGQSGSSSINKVVGESINSLLGKYIVIHLTGLKDERKYKNNKLKIKDGLGDRYTAYGIVDPIKFNEIFNTSDILISRAGANTVSKIVFAKKPSVLIPYPFSYLDEQTKNAEFAAEYAGTRVVGQDKLTPKRLIEEVNYISDNWGKIPKKIKSIKNPDIKASEKIVDLIEKYMK